MAAGGVTNSDGLATSSRLPITWGNNYFIPTTWANFISFGKKVFLNITPFDARLSHLASSFFGDHGREYLIVSGRDFEGYFLWPFASHPAMGNIVNLSWE